MTCPQPRAGACRHCRHPLPPSRKRGGPRVYCSHACSRLGYQKDAIARARAAGADPMRLIRALREETPPGLCIYCDEPVPQKQATRRRILCGSPDCLRLYNRDYQNARRNPPETLEARGDT